MEKRNTFKAVLLLMTGTIIAKVLGFLREILFAHQFGAGELSDAFMLVRGLPDILFGAIALAININFIPIYMRDDDSYRRNYFVSNLISVCLVFSFIGCLLLNVIPRQIILIFAASFPEETMTYAIVLLRIVSFALAPIVLGCIFQSYSQANGEFLSTALTGIITNIIIILMILASSKETYYLLSVGVVLSQLFLMLMLWYSARRSGLRYSHILNFRDSNLREMVILTLPVLAENLAWNFCVLVDRNIGAYLGVGIIANMAYGQLISNSLGSTVSNAVTTVAFPDLSRLAVDKDFNNFILSLIKYFRLLLYMLIPVSFFMAFFSSDIIGCLFGHGAIRPSDVKIISECAACYALGILPMGCKGLYVKGFYTFRNTKTPTYAGVLALLCNVVLSILFAEVCGYIGVALATSLSFFIACVLLEVFFYLHYKISIFRKLRRDVLLTSIVAVASCLVTYRTIDAVCIFDYLVIRVMSEFVLFFFLYNALFFIIRRDLFLQVMSFVCKRE